MVRRLTTALAMAVIACGSGAIGSANVLMIQQPAARITLLDRFLAPDDQPLVSYRAFRHLSASTRGGRMHASIDAWTTLDPVRGYDDYQIVPEKFIHKIYTTTETRHDYDPLALPDSTLTLTTSTTVRYPGGRFFATYTVEEQFPVVHPLHAVVFFDAGNTWDLFHEIRPFDLKMGAGVGLRLEIPLLGNVGFDFGYGFNRDDGPRTKGHFLLGNVNF